MGKERALVIAWVMKIGVKVKSTRIFFSHLWSRTKLNLLNNFISYAINLREFSHFID